MLQPKETRIKLKGNTGNLILKCVKDAKKLEWKEVLRYFKNTSLHWSPWGPIKGREENSPPFGLKLPKSYTLRGSRK